MPSWLDIRANKDAYPDDLQIEVKGEKMTLGEFRKELGPVSEFTKQTQKLSQERDQATQAYHQAAAQQQQAQALLQQLQQQRQQTVNPHAGYDPLDPMTVYRQDAAFSPVVGYMDRQIDDLKSTVRQQAQYLQQATVAMNTARYEGQLQKLKEKNAELDTTKLAQFTTEFYSKGPDLDAAFKLYTYDERLKHATDEAERRGYDKAKAEPPAPPAPGGRRGFGTPAPHALPNNLDERVTLAMQDGALMRDLEQGLSELQHG